MKKLWCSWLSFSYSGPQVQTASLDSLSGRNWGLPIILLLLTLSVNIGRIIRHSFKDADEIKMDAPYKTTILLNLWLQISAFHTPATWLEDIILSNSLCRNGDENVYSCDKWQWWLSWKAEEAAQWEKAIAPQVKRPEFRALELTPKHSSRERGDRDRVIPTS